MVKMRKMVRQTKSKLVRSVEFLVKKELSNIGCDVKNGRQSVGGVRSIMQYQCLRAMYNYEVINFFEYDSEFIELNNQLIARRM